MCTSDKNLNDNCICTCAQDKHNSGEQTEEYSRWTSRVENIKKEEGRCTQEITRAQKGRRTYYWQPYQEPQRARILHPSRNVDHGNSDAAALVLVFRAQAKWFPRIFPGYVNSRDPAGKKERWQRKLKYLERRRGKDDGSLSLRWSFRERITKRYWHI